MAWKDVTLHTFVLTSHYQTQNTKQSLQKRRDSSAPHDNNAGQAVVDVGTCTDRPSTMQRQKRYQFQRKGFLFEGVLKTATDAKTVNFEMPNQNMAGTF